MKYFSKTLLAFFFIASLAPSQAHWSYITGESYSTISDHIKGIYNNLDKINHKNIKGSMEEIVGLIFHSSPLTKKGSYGVENKGLYRLRYNAASDKYEFMSIISDAPETFGMMPALAAFVGNYYGEIWGDDFNTHRLITTLGVASITDEAIKERIAYAFRFMAQGAEKKLGWDYTGFEDSMVEKTAFLTKYRHLGKIFPYYACGQFILGIIYDFM